MNYLISIVRSIWNKIANVNFDKIQKSSDDLNKSVPLLTKHFDDQLAAFKVYVDSRFDKVDKAINDLATAEPQPLPAVAIDVEWTDEEGRILQGDPMDIKVGKQIVGTISKVRDKYGNDTVLDGPVTWKGVGDVFASVTPSEDGNSVTVVIGTVAGLDGNITATGDSKIGEGETLVTSTNAFHSIPDDAAEILVSFGEPTDVPPAP